MQAGPKSMWGVFTSTERFVIPEYQRPYVWTKEEVEQLWNDLNGAFIESNGEEEYFLGPLVVASQKDESTGAPISYVVDGQQRLTTLQSLLWIFYNYLNGSNIGSKKDAISRLKRILTTADGKNLLAVAIRDQSNFSAVRDGADVDETTSLGVIASFLRSKVKNYEDKQVVEFLNFIENRTRFILVETESFSSAWELFIGLNGKGKPLSPADLIKAYICGKSHDNQEVANIWETDIVPLGDDATSAILDICRAATGEKSSDAKLFKTFEKAWLNKDVTMNSLSSGGIAFHRFWIQPIRKVLSGNRAMYLRSLRALRRRDITPVLIALSTKYSFDILFKQGLLEVLDAYQLWMGISGLRGRERDFSNTAYEILNNENLSESEALLELVQLIEELVPSKEKVKESVAQSAYRGRVMLHIVKSYEEGMRGNVQINDIWFEHIMPQTGTDYWFKIAETKDKNVYTRIVNNIGNITPLDPKTDIKARNDEWSIKRRLYMEEVPNWLISELARKHPEKWGPEDIKDRANTIAEWVVNKRWPLDKYLKLLIESSRNAELNN
ncbi:MAG: DUF262 domain-containing protein [Candidatus Lokiarchaeota archaeon]|nr:DUF262 domain-containing protein [Candidatus Lokiarchaeota archaeon]